jgi:hypothetical protein
MQDYAAAWWPALLLAPSASYCGRDQDGPHVVPDAMRAPATDGKQRPHMHVHIAKRSALLIAGAILAVAIMLGAGKVYANTTANTARSDTTVRMTHEREAAVTKALAAQKKTMDAERIERVRTAAKEARASQKKRDRAVLRRVVGAQVDRRERETSAAQQSGFSSGSAAGFSSGHQEGQEEGYEDGAQEATDQVTCSDDPDVGWLPYC